MDTPISHRGALGGFAAAVIALALGILLPASAQAAPTLGLVATDAGVGQAIHATAELTESSPTASGEISFEIFGPGDTDCSGSPLAPAPASAVVSGEGQYDSGDVVPPGAGTYRWSAHYSGDGENPEADSTCSALSDVAKASPGLSGSASSAVVGNAIDDTATLSAGFGASGLLVFSAYGPDDEACATTPAYEEAVAVNGNGAYSPVGFSPAAGLYRWRAAYSGDGNNEPVSTTCGAPNQTSTVSKASPSLSGTATATATVGQTITDSATLSGGFAITGQLVFRAYGPGGSGCATTPAYEASVSVTGAGTYAPAGFAPGPGTYRWQVEYQGDANNQATSTTCGATSQGSSVAKALPGLSGTATATATVGQTITDSATLSGGFAPTGQLVFRAYGPEDDNCEDSPVYEKTVAAAGGGSYSPAGFAPGPGTYLWTVEYTGDANNAGTETSCGAANQSSVVGKASPALEGTATSAVLVGQTITDKATLSGGFAATGQLSFRAYGPGDETCAGAPVHEETVAVSGDGNYPAAGFPSPLAGLYRWTVAYSGDANNAAAATACGAANQSSAVGTVAIDLTASATGSTVGEPVVATATLFNGAIPTGQITFKAFPAGDASCSGAPLASSVANVSGNGTYRSTFVPTRVGIYRWAVAYSGDPNHAPATVECGKATSTVAKAKPTIAGKVAQRLTVGTSFRDTATLQGGYQPGGTVTFRIYGPVASGCAKPVFVNTVAVNGNGTVSSDPFVAQRPGRYSFVASYSGDAENQAATEPCDSAAQVAAVGKREPKVKPRARLIGGRLIAIRAHLSGGASPTGLVNFRLFAPGDKRCKRRPAFSGGITVNANGSYSLAKYLATRPGVYRLEVGYSGDQRNQRYRPECSGAQPIRVG